MSEVCLACGRPHEPRTFERWPERAIPFEARLVKRANVQLSRAEHEALRALKVSMSGLFVGGLRDRIEPDRTSRRRVRIAVGMTRADFERATGEAASLGLSLSSLLRRRVFAE